MQIPLFSEQNLRSWRKKQTSSHLTTDDIRIFRIITGLTDSKLREKLLRLDKPSLEEVESTCTLYETTKASMKAYLESDNSHAAAAWTERTAKYSDEGPQDPTSKTKLKQTLHEMWQGTP